MTVAIVFAGGSGVRMGAGIPKQFLEINEKPVLAYTLEIFERHPLVDQIVLVSHPDFMARTKELCEKFCITKVGTFAEGGASAQDSIYIGLVATASRYGRDTTVLLHDGVRPYVDASVIDAVINSVERYGNGVTYTPCYETVVLSKNGERIDAIPARRESFTAQAPQGFRLGDILAAHEKVRAMPGGYDGLVDQATLYWQLGLPIHLVPGNRGNIKITTPEDLYTLRALIQWQEDRSKGLTTDDFR